MDKYLRLKNVTDKQFKKVEDLISKEEIKSTTYNSGYDAWIEEEAEFRLRYELDNNLDITLKKNETFQEFMDKNIKGVIDALSDDNYLINDEYCHNDACDVLKANGYYSSEEDNDDVSSIAFETIEKFEDILDANDINIPDSERNGDSEESRIYGKTYYTLEDSIKGYLNNNYIIKRKKDING